MDGYQLAISPPAPNSREILAMPHKEKLSRSVKVLALAILIFVLGALAFYRLPFMAFGPVCWDGAMAPGKQSLFKIRGHPSAEFARTYAELFPDHIIWTRDGMLYLTPEIWFTYVRDGYRAGKFPGDEWLIWRYYVTDQIAKKILERRRKEGRVTFEMLTKFDVRTIWFPEKKHFGLKIPAGRPGDCDFAPELVMRGGAFSSD
jgi:hypothetical protein